MDAGLAKVINSTVGTGNFKSLDKVLFDGARLVASEDVMYEYDKTFTKKEVSTNSEGAGTPAKGVLTADKYITFDMAGTVYIKTQQTIYSTASANKPARVVLSVLNESGTVITSVDTGETELTSAVMTMFLELNVTPGTKYKIKMEGYRYYQAYPIQKFSVCGKPVLFGATVSTV